MSPDTKKTAIGFALSLAAVIIISLIASTLRAAEAPPPAASAAADWLKENVEEVREAKKLLVEFDRNKDVLTTFNCNFDWDALRIVDCPLE